MKILEFFAKALVLTIVVICMFAIIIKVEAAL